jgi:hypothetical protein
MMPEQNAFRTGRTAGFPLYLRVWPFWPGY